MEKMNLVQLELQTEIVERKLEFEKEMKAHKEETETVERGGD